MKTQDYPLVFTVEGNFIYNKLIDPHLGSNNVLITENFLGAEECLNNLYKKPNVETEDQLVNEVISNVLLRKSKKSNRDTEFIPLSGFDDFDVAANTIKYNTYNYAIRDMLALKKLLDGINKIRKVNENKHIRFQSQRFGITLFLIAFTSMIMSLVGWAMIFPKAFTF